VRYGRDGTWVELLLAVTLLAGVATGCAARGDRVPAVSQVDQRARRVSCGADLRGSESDAGSWVSVPVVVGADGYVTEVGTPRHVGNEAGSAVLDEAVTDARACLFWPAELNGAFVPVRFRLFLWIPE